MGLGARWKREVSTRRSKGLAGLSPSPRTGRYSLPPRETGFAVGTLPPGRRLTLPQAASRSVLWPCRQTAAESRSLSSAGPVVGWACRQAAAHVPIRAEKGSGLQDAQRKIITATYPSEELALVRAFGSPSPDAQAPQPFSGHCVAIAPDGKLVVAGSATGEMAAWDDTGKRLWQQHVHQGKIAQLVFTDDGRTLISTGADLRVIWREAATGRELRKVSARESGAGKTGKDYLQEFWRGLRQGLAHVRGAGETANPDDDEKELFDGRLALADGRLLAVCDEQVQLWELASGKRRRVFPAVDRPGRNSVGRIEYPYTLVLDTTRDHDWLNSVGGNGCPAAALSADGRLLALPRGEMIHLFDAVAGKDLRACGGVSDVTDLALSPDGRLLAASGHEEVCLWETATGTSPGPAAWTLWAGPGRCLLGRWPHAGHGRG